MGRRDGRALVRHDALISADRVRSVHSYLAVEDLRRVLVSTFAVEPTRLSALHFGVNDSYLVETSTQRFVLRVYRANRRTMADVGAELTLLLDLGDEGVPVPSPVLTRDGELSTPIAAAEGTRPTALLTYIEGEPVTGSGEDARDVGAAAARVHAAAPARLGGTRPRYDEDELLTASLDRIRRAFGHRTADIARLDRKVEAWRADLAASRLPDSPMGVIHGDIQPQNALRRPDGAIALIDFDEFGIGWRVDDLALFIAGSRLRGGMGDVEISLLEGYESVMPLTPEERQAIETFVQIRIMWVVAWQLRMSAGWGPAAWLGDEWFERHMRLLHSP